MSGPLLIQQGPSPTWWLSPAIWVTEATPPYSIVANPVAGKTYNVQVQVENPYPEPVASGWSHGNALVNVTQSLRGHVVGGLSVLLLGKTKA